MVASGTFAPLYPLTASNVTDTTATLTLSTSGTWYAKYTTPTGGTCSDAVSGGLDLTNLQRSTSYTYEAYSDSACTTVIGRTSFTTTANWLAVSDVTATTATLTLTGHTGNWWIKKTAPTPAGSCGAGEADFSHAVGSLTSSRTYTYTAYSDSGCSTALRTASFTTAVTVSTLSESGGGTHSRVGYFVGPITQQSKEAAQGFTTGSNTSGYTLSGVTVRVSGKTGSPGAFEVKLHAASGVNIGSRMATLSGSDPTGSGDYTYTCTPSSSDNCALSRNTTYYIWLEAPNAPTNANNYYTISTTASTGETRVPAANGWNFANNGRERHGNIWTTNSHVLRIEVASPPGPSFVASGITATTATLTLTGKGGGWWLKRTTPAGGTCAAGEGDYTHALSSLDPGTAYTYKAYGDSACATAALQSVTFTTAVTVSNLSETNSATTLPVWSNSVFAQGFMTGSITNGYTFTSVALEFYQVYTAANVTVTLRAAQSNGTPATTALATLTGTPAAGNVTFSCSGSGCALTKDTQYFVHVAGSSGSADAALRATESDAQAPQPSANGWSIADAARDKSRSWAEHAQSVAMKLKVTALPK